jgi:alkanesulfonate monooxygenase SsuD/methylene tetrahydromethanopterin reductase-like flavin-dependent oxidoreductase (luciferase family)
MTPNQLAEYRATHVPLFNDQPFKLALFAFNLSGGLSMTMAEGKNDPTWEQNVRLAKLADRHGFEALIPVCRWKGFNAPSGFHSKSFETFTWAAGLGAETNYTMVTGTCHIPAIHPVIAAKQSVTVDHITRGRFALNLVAGWFQDELELFGARMLDHDGRYAHAREWLEIVKRLWTVDGEFDYPGDFYQLRRAAALPKPIQQPHPIVINAGASPTGRRFCAEHADVLFITAPEDLEAGARTIAEVRRVAREEFGRDVRILSTATVVCRPTEKEAQHYWNYCVIEKGDQVAADTYLGIIAKNIPRFGGDETRRLRNAFIAGLASAQLIGTPAQIVDYFKRLSNAGYDGASVSFLNFDEGLPSFCDDILPLMVQSGLRHEHSASLL